MRGCLTWPCFLLLVAGSLGVRLQPVDGGAAECSGKQNSWALLPIPEFAVNPLEPMLRVFNHPVFSHFGVQTARFDEDYVFEAMGVSVHYQFDCNTSFTGIAGSTVRARVVSRNVGCTEHEARLKLPPSLRPGYVAGHFPIVDDEYLEFVDLLLSVVEHDFARPYVVVELGARYGVWAVRGVQAARQLKPNVDHVAVLVESEDRNIARATEHCDKNKVRCTLHKGLVGTGLGDLSIHHILGSIEPHVIDFVDLDIQGVELPVLSDPDVMPLLVARVKRLHIGTHSPEIHSTIKNLFLGTGWTLSLDYAWGYRQYHSEGVVVLPGCTWDAARQSGADMWVWDSLQQNPHCLQQTDFGPVYVRDGLLGFANPNFLADVLTDDAAQSTHYHKSCNWPHDIDGCLAWVESCNKSGLHMPTAAQVSASGGPQN